MVTSRPWLIVLIPYFGTWPPWINFFMASCRTNPDVVWRFYTDCGTPANLPDNVEIVEMAFADYCAFASERLGFPFAPTDPYKLCDLKPALGHIHARDIAGFEFYAFGDIDVIYGRLSSFYPLSLRRRFDILSTHGNDISGHLCLFRNSGANRQFFRRMRSFRKNLGEPIYKGLDEEGLTRAIAKTRKLASLLRPWRWFGLRPWPRVQYREQFSTILSVRGWIDGTMNYPATWRWREGSLTADGSGAREFLYLHFMRWKSLRYAGNPPQAGQGAWLTLEKLARIDWRRAAREGFSISANGFGPVAGDGDQPAAGSGAEAAAP